MNKIHLFFWISTAVLFVFLILQGLFMDGMFADGTQYACVSKNLAEGRGSFWFPFLSETWWKQGSNAFLEQPPLMYALQSLFFKILGNSLFTERIYILFTALFTGFMIHLIWREFAPLTFRNYSWLPLIFWMSIPLMSWTFKQNMQENTMGMFTISAIYFGLHSIYHKERWQVLALLTGLFIFLASLTKGIPGLFPLTIAGIAWITTGKVKFSKAAGLTLLYILVPIVIYGLLLLNETARESLTFYFKYRLVKRVETDPVVSSHLYMLGRLLLELSPALLITGSLYLTTTILKVRSIPGTAETSKTGMFFLLGLSGSLPLMLTLVQRGFYMSHSFPCFALAFAFLTAPIADKLIRGIGPQGLLFRVVNSIMVLLLASGIILTFVFAGKPGRNSELLSDVYVLGEILEPYRRVSCDAASYNNWPFQFYMLRYHDVYLENSSRKLDYTIVEKGTLPMDPENYERIETGTSLFDLYIIK